MKDLLSGPRNRAAEEKFCKLVYEPPPNIDSEIVDIIMESFLKPFDSSVMQTFVSALSGIDFEQYYDSYFKILPRLIHKDPNSALCLLNYPGFELKHEHISKIVRMIKKTDPSGALKKDLDYQINYWNLQNDEPWYSIYHFA
ncbi:hypothetical protein [Pseudomonas fluorescens]|nr:hypothetical protein [Pseudomonas fluorescens]